MATAEDGGVTAKTTNANTSSYGGGGAGAGGKFRRKPFRKPTTPYDRPHTALRGSDNNGGWLTKLVVDPASKLISYGAHRLFSSVFRKRLPPPPPPRASELNQGLTAGLQEAVPNNQSGEQEPAGGECSQQINSSTSNGISDLEQLLKQNTFTRSEIDHLTELLQSRAGEAPLRDAGKSNVETTSDFGGHQQIAISPSEENRNEGVKSHGVMPTPVSNSKVLEDDIASPAELARAYMDNRSSKVSPMMLGMHSQVGKEDARLISETRFSLKSPLTSLKTKTSISLGAPENGFFTPRSRGRSAMYSMPRSPYSRVHPTSTLKGIGINNIGYAGQTSSASLSLMEHGQTYASKPMTLKRRSSVLDYETGSVGPIRRIRQKSNLIAPRTPPTAEGAGTASDAVVISLKQKFPLTNEKPKQASNVVYVNEDNSVPSRSYVHVPSKSSEVAARILQHLEKLTPKEKSSESKLVAAVLDKSPFKLTPAMLRGQALRSMEDIGSSKLLLDVQDDHKLENESNVTLTDPCYSTSQERGEVKENAPQEIFVPSDTRYPVTNNDSVVSLKVSGLISSTSNSVGKDSIPQPSQKKRAFRMSAQEDSLELDDDLHFNGLASKPSSEGGGPVEAHFTDSKLSPAEEPVLVRSTSQPEVKAPGLISSRTGDLSSPGAVTVGEGSFGIAFPTSGQATVAGQSAVLPLSIASSDKPKEANNPPPVFSFISKVADKVPSLPSESSNRMPESKPESSSSLVNVCAPAGPLVKIHEIEKGGILTSLKVGEKDGISPSAPISGSHAGSVPAVSPSGTNRIPTGGPVLVTSSTGSGTTNSAISSGTIFGLDATPSVSAGPVFTFGASVDPSTAVSAVSTMNTPVGDLKSRSDADQSSGSSSSSLTSVAAFEAANSGNSSFGLGSSFSYSTANNHQGSLFNIASKTLVSVAGALSQGRSVQSVIPASLPLFNMISSTSIGSSLSNSQVFNSNTTAFNFPASSSDTGAVVPSGGPTSSSVVFGISTSAVAEGSAVSSSTAATSGTFSFGLSSSSSSSNAVGSTAGASSAVFSLGGSSSVSPSATNTFSSATSGIFNIGGSSSASSSAISSVTGSNSAPLNVFGSGWQSPKSSIFGSLPTSSPSTGFSFGASSSASTSAAPVVFNSSSGPSASPIFSFTTAAASSSLLPSVPQPIFAPPGNNDQMNAEDSMAEDPVQSSAPSIPVFGQPAVSPSPPGFMFGSAVPPQANPFQFGQQNQVAPQNPSPFQASSSLEFNAGGSFSLGSGGGDKSGRKFVKISRNKNRKK
ncbi:nuclear pore complex protein NUP1 [Sesamum indicum]|uniref:Nuclear pore complex protein NUP1 n=1 Tax=Sesamum indicum TaxID=4182 RepID=A0A8M8V4B6_SESIN|nr:nuclear pore complex protein NUP1 [Sesamum indicum]